MSVCVGLSMQDHDSSCPYKTQKNMCTKQRKHEDRATAPWGCVGKGEGIVYK
jgi:hypothetical protein